MLSSISAFFPCYNDSETIRDLVLSVEAVLKRVTTDYEIIAVDDGSADNSVEVLKQLAAEVPHFRFVQHGKNRGYGSALATGFRSATKDYVFYTDGDGQYDPAELQLLVDAMAPGIDVVNGYKRNRQDPWYRLLVGNIYQQMARIMFSLPIRDVDCDFRLMRRDALRDIELESKDGAICVELVRKLRDCDRTMIERPVTHYARAFGTSQFFKPDRILRAVQGVTAWYVKLVILRQQKRRFRALARQRALASAGDA